jgi:hypothetical protein
MLILTFSFPSRSRAKIAAGGFLLRNFITEFGEWGGCGGGGRRICVVSVVTVNQPFHANISALLPKSTCNRVLQSGKWCSPLFYPCVREFHEFRFNQSWYCNAGIVFISEFFEREMQPVQPYSDSWRRDADMSRDTTTTYVYPMV